jgi:hypothetical protein
VTSEGGTRKSNFSHLAILTERVRIWVLPWRARLPPGMTYGTICMTLGKSTFRTQHSALKRCHKKNGVDRVTAHPVLFELRLLAYSVTPTVNIFTSLKNSVGRYA